MFILFNESRYRKKLFIVIKSELSGVTPMRVLVKSHRCWWVLVKVELHQRWCWWSHTNVGDGVGQVTPIMMMVLVKSHQWWWWWNRTTHYGKMFYVDIRKNLFPTKIAGHGGGQLGDFINWVVNKQFLQQSINVIKNKFILINLKSSWKFHLNPVPTSPEEIVEKEYLGLKEMSIKGRKGSILKYHQRVQWIFITQTSARIQRYILIKWLWERDLIWSISSDSRHVGADQSVFDNNRQESNEFCCSWNVYVVFYSLSPRDGLDVTARARLVKLVTFRQFMWNSAHSERFGRSVENVRRQFRLRHRTYHCFPQMTTKNTINPHLKILLIADPPDW